MTNRIHHLHHPEIYQQNVTKRKSTDKPNKSFQDILNTKQSIKVSKHAKDRMVQRNIHLSDRQWNSLEQKMSEAKQKGVRESVVILKQATLLVNAEKKTIITALNNDESDNKIFTNINGTIILND